MGDWMAVVLCLMVLMGLALWFVWLEYRSRRVLMLSILPLAAAFLLRGFCLDYTSGDYISFLSQWAEFFRQNGGFRAIAMSVGDYNLPYLYFIAAISYLKIPDLYLYKLFSILFDVLLAWGSLRLTRTLLPERTRRTLLPLAAFLVTLFLPTVVLNGSLWGQCDSIYGALVLLGVGQLLEDHPRRSTALMAVAFSFKLQTIFVLPVWGAVWLTRRIKLRHLLWFPAVYLGTILPGLLLGKPMAEILSVYLGQAGEYSQLTLNAPSVYQFIPYQAEVNETMLGYLGVGIALLLVAALLAAAVTMGRRWDRGVFFVMTAVLAIGVPFFLPHMHERYFFLADALTLCWAVADRKKLPVCILVNASSLASYLVYLRLQYNCIISVWGVMFVMPLEAAAMLTALILTADGLLIEIKRCKVEVPYKGESYEAGILERKWSAGLSEKGVHRVNDGAGRRCDLPAGDEDGTGAGGGGASGIS